MSSFRNRIQLEGNLGKDAELKSTPHGDVVKFSIAVNERWTDKKTNTKQERTDWFDVEVWGGATKFAATLTKGTPVVVEGKIRTSEYTAKEVKHKAWSIIAQSLRRIDYGSNIASQDAEDDATETPV